MILRRPTRREGGKGKYMTRKYDEGKGNMTREVRAKSLKPKGNGCD